MNECRGYYVKWKVRYRKTNTVWSQIYMRSQKVEFIETEYRMVVTKRKGIGEIERCWSKGRDFSVIGWMNSDDLMYRMMTIVNNTVLCIGEIG